MSTHSETTDTILEALRLFEQGIDKLRNGPAEYYFKKLQEQIDLLFTKYPPFKLGDQVELVRDVPDLDKSHGWWHCRHFLKRGAQATVQNIEADKDSFVFLIEFDDESWIDSEGEVHIVEKKHKHVFNFRETMLRKIGSSDSMAEAKVDAMRIELDALRRENKRLNSKLESLAEMLNEKQE